MIILALDLGKFKAVHLRSKDPSEFLSLVKHRKTLELSLNQHPCIAVNDRQGQAPSKPSNKGTYRDRLSCNHK